MKLQYSKHGLLFFYISLGWCFVFYVLSKILWAIELSTPFLDLSGPILIANILTIIYGLGVLGLPIGFLVDYIRAREEEEKRERDVLKAAWEMIEEIKRKIKESIINSDESRTICSNFSVPTSCLITAIDIIPPARPPTK